jgi:hypothetical protein
MFRRLSLIYNQGLMWQALCLHAIFIQRALVRPSPNSMGTVGRLTAKLLLTLASTAILGSESYGNHDQILLLTALGAFRPLSPVGRVRWSVMDCPTADRLGNSRSVIWIHVSCRWPFLTIFLGCLVCFIMFMVENHEQFRGNPIFLLKLSGCNRISIAFLTTRTM